MIDPEKLYGVWRLSHGVSTLADGSPGPVPYGGAEAMCLLQLRRDGRMISVMCDSRPALPAGAPREYVSYCGAYTFDGETLVTRVDATSDPARMGTDQVRKVRMEGALLALTPPPRSHEGQAEHRELFWEKIADV